MATEIAPHHRFTEFATFREFTVDEYRRMAELGIIPDGATELIDGRILIDGRPWRFSTDDYYRLAEAGILSEDDRVELIYGEIVDMKPIGSRHSGTVNRLHALFIRELGERVVVSGQNPLRLPDGTEPQPDLMLLRPREDFYTESHPTPEDVLLLIEVADTSVGYDRTDKADVYAGAGIAEYWLADVGRRRVFLHTDPVPTGYTRVVMKEYEESWSSRSLPELTISGKDIFG